MIVVDVGCAEYPNHPEDKSIGRLIKRFHPTHLYGFDPHPSVVATRIVEDGCVVHIDRKAAWASEGYIGYTTKPKVINELRSFTDADGKDKVPCFDLANFLYELPRGDVVLKLDVEGAEYVLIPHLHATRADELISLLLIEWHGPIIQGLRCPVEEW